jgi:hypothetical protein
MRVKEALSCLLVLYYLSCSVCLPRLLIFMKVVHLYADGLFETGVVRPGNQY